MASPFKRIGNHWGGKGRRTSPIVLFRSCRGHRVFWARENCTSTDPAEEHVRRRRVRVQNRENPGSFVPVRLERRSTDGARCLPRQL